MKYLSSQPNVCAGDLTIKGTRICISTAIVRLAHGWTVNDLHKSWPHVPLATLRGALDEAAELLSTKTHAETSL